MEFLIQRVDFARRRHGEAKGGSTLVGKWPQIKRTWAYIFKMRRELVSRQRWGDWNALDPIRFETQVSSSPCHGKSNAWGK
jgi:hypothetical protein